MRLGTAPHPVSDLSSNYCGIVGDVCGVIYIGDLNTLDGWVAICLISIHHDVIRLDVCVYDSPIV